jgi:hypothetical protein
MTRPVLTIRTDYPRIHCNAADKTPIFNRSNLASAFGGWKTEWDGKVIPYCDSTLAKSTATLAAESNLDAKFFSLGLASWIDGVDAYFVQLKATGLYFLEHRFDNKPGTTEPYQESFINRREQIIAMAYGYQFLRAAEPFVPTFFTDDERRRWGTNLLAMCTAGTNPNEYIDGHSAGNVMSQLIAALVLYGESGAGYNFTSDSTTIINNTLDFFYGENPGSTAYLDSDRYLHGDGGSGNGCGYNILENRSTFMVLEALKWACTSITLDGNAYDPYTSETWVAKHGEWWVRTFSRGDKDFLRMGDSGRQVNPFLDQLAKFDLNVLIRNGGPWRKAVRWLRDRVFAAANVSPLAISNYHYAIDVAMWRPSDLDNASQSLKTAGASKGRLFTPNGDFIHDSDLEMDDGVKTHFQMKEFDFFGHTHLANGSLQICVGNDMVLIGSGRYDTSPGDTKEDFNGLHHRWWYQQSVAQSGVPLIEDPNLDDLTQDLAHRAKQGPNGSISALKSGMGGQLWKRFDLGGTFLYDPNNINEMRNQGGKLAWRRSGKDAAGTDKLRIVEKVDGRYWFLYGDYTYSYVREHTDVETVRQRATLVETKLLIIEDVTTDPIIIKVDRVISRVASFKKRMLWHTYGNPIILTQGAGTNQERIVSSAQGYRGTGKIEIHTYNGAQKWTAVRFGGNAPNNLDSLAAGQFAYNGVEYAPTFTPNSREKPDFGRWWVEVSPVGAQLENQFLTALFPLRVGQSAPTYEWIDEPTWIGVRFGLKEYRIAKTTVQLVVGDAPPVQPMPPHVPTGLVAVSGPQSGEVTLNWNPNTDSPFKYQAKSRVRV